MEADDKVVVAIRIHDDPTDEHKVDLMLASATTKEVEVITVDRSKPVEYLITNETLIWDERCHDASFEDYERLFRDALNTFI